MDSDSWTDLLSTSKPYQSRNDLYLGFEDIENDEDYSQGDPNHFPFYSEDFDIIELCSYIDEELPAQAKNECRRRFRKGGSRSTLSLLKKQLHEGNLQSHLGGSSELFSSSNTEPDPLLSQFFHNLPTTEEPSSSIAPSYISAELELVDEASEEQVIERNVQQPSSLSKKDKEEKESRSEFVQGLLLSTMFDDIL